MEGLIYDPISANGPNNKIQHRNNIEECEAKKENKHFIFGYICMFYFLYSSLHCVVQWCSSAPSGQSDFPSQNLSDGIQ